jgi:hypothetical protein
MEGRLRGSQRCVAEATAVRCIEFERKLLMDEDRVESESEIAPRKRARRIAYKLNSIGGVISELGAVYRAFTRGEISSQKAQTRKALLSEIRAAVEGVELAKRLDEIEALVKGESSTAPNLRIVK